MNNFTGFFRGVTWLIFLGALLWAYAYMTSSVTYRIDADGNSVGIVDRDTFFFAAVGAFLLVNVVCVGFINVLKKIKTTEDGEGIRNRSLKLDIMGWTKGFAGVLNLFLTFTLIFLGYMNLSEEFMVEGMGFFIYLGPVLLVVWFFYLVKLITKKRN